MMWTDLTRFPTGDGIVSTTNFAQDVLNMLPGVPSFFVREHKSFHRKYLPDPPVSINYRALVILLEGTMSTRRHPYPNLRFSAVGLPSRSGLSS